MRNIFVLLLTTLLLTGCSRIDKIQDNNNFNSTINVVIPTDLSINDLVYHNYGTHITLTKRISLKFENLDINLKTDETAIIYLVNLKTNRLIRICEYKSGQSVTYNSTLDGVFKVVAEINNEIPIDLTAKTIIQEKSIMKRHYLIIKSIYL